MQCSSNISNTIFQVLKWKAQADPYKYVKYILNSPAVLFQKAEILFLRTLGVLNPVVSNIKVHLNSIVCFCNSVCVLCRTLKNDSEKDSLVSSDWNSLQFSQCFQTDSIQPTPRGCVHNSHSWSTQNSK